VPEAYTAIPSESCKAKAVWIEREKDTEKKLVEWIMLEPLDGLQTQAVPTVHFGDRDGMSRIFGGPSPSS